jgi:hypothetical protein
MAISDTYKRLVREAFKDMTTSEQQDFLSWGLQIFLTKKLKDSSETKTMP